MKEEMEDIGNADGLMNGGRAYEQWGQYHRASTLKRWLLAYARLYGGIASTVMNGTRTPI
jgi:hypothetical protein